MAENSFSRILANLGSPEKSISDASASKSTSNLTEFEMILKFYDHKTLASLFIRFPLSLILL